MQSRLGRLVDHILAVMMAALFATFILQIVTRYLAKFGLGSDYGWTQDFSQTCMVWVVFFGGAFALAQSDHVKFDMIYNMFSTGARRVLVIITSVVIVVLLAWSLPATIDSWLGQLWRWNKPNPTLKVPFTGTAIPMWAIFSIYAIFAVAIIVRGVWRVIRMLAGDAPDGNDAAAAAAAAERAS